MVKPVTLRQVAGEAQVSPAAISRYLNGTLELPQPTRTRIDRAVRELGYRPNPHARSLSRGRSDAVGLVIPELDNPFFSRLAAAIERAAETQGIAVMLCSTSNKTAREVDYIEKLNSSLVDGLLFATNHHDADGALAKAINDARRMVILDEDVPGAEVARIFKRVASRLNLDPTRPLSRISAHSTRIGAAQDLTAAGAALPEIMVAGGWKSPQMPAHYSRKLHARQGAMRRMLRGERK